MTNSIILGDLNCNILDDTADSRTFKELCATFNLTQLVKEPTRITEKKRSLIDVIMCTDPTLAESCSVIASSISDHNLTEVTLRIRRPKVKAKYVTARSYSRYTSDSFCEDLLLVPWHMVHFFDDNDSQLETFNSLFLDVLDQHASIKRVKIKSRPNPFVTPEIKQFMKTRDCWHKKAIQTNDKLCWNGYRFFRQEVKRELNLAEKTHVRNEIANSRGNTNAIWKILNRCMSRGIAKHPSTLEDHKTLANKFNKYFTSVGKLTAYKANLIIEEQGFHKEWGPREERMEIGLHAEQEGFEFQNVNETDVKSVIKSLASNKASGYDKISARVLKDSCESIAPVISRLVTNSFQVASFPKAWKIAEVIPVPKESNSEEPANNRSISLLPVISKVC